MPNLDRKFWNLIILWSIAFFMCAFFLVRYAPAETTKPGQTGVPGASVVPLATNAAKLKVGTAFNPASITPAPNRIVSTSTGTYINDGWINPSRMLVSSGTITPAATSFTISGLDAEAHGGYYFELYIINAYAGSNTLSMYYNSHTTATDYRWRVVGGSDGNQAYIGSSMGQNYTGFFTGHIYQSPALIVMSQGLSMSSSTADIVTPGIWTQRKLTAVSANITSITFTGATSGIGAGSTYKIWRKL